MIKSYLSRFGLSCFFVFTHIKLKFLKGIESGFYREGTSFILPHLNLEGGSDPRGDDTALGF